MKRITATAGIVAATATAGLLTFATPASATGADTTAGQGQRLDRVCEKRIPAWLERIERRQERIAGDAQTKGSVAWWEARADRARANDHEVRAARLERRAEHRAETGERLEKREARIEAFAAKHCD